MSKYIGNRYVPLHCGKWDKTKSYESLSVVIDDEGNSYTSIKNVPSQIELTDTNFWVLSGIFNLQYASLIEQTENIKLKTENNIKKLKGLVVADITEFGASVDKDDNHDSIINALNYANSNGGGLITIPVGIFKTSPISFKDLSNITIQGQVSSKPWQITSQLKFIDSDNKIGLQLCEEGGYGYTNEIPSWTSKCITIRNLFLDCDYKIEHGINAHHELVLDNVTIRHANSHGIVLEPQTYPVILKECESSFNKGDGLFIKSPNTTCWKLYDSEFGYNEGYGINIEGGHTCSLINVLCQSNKKGGYRLYKPNKTLYNKGVYMDKILFISCYAEENGTLEKIDLNYDGNYALKISGYNIEQGTNADKITGLQFINCTFNKSSIAENPILIEGVSDFIDSGSEISKSYFDYTKCGNMGVKRYYENSDLINNTPIPILKPYQIEDKNFKGFITEGLITKRGRIRVMEFKLPYSELVADNTIPLKPCHNLTKLPGYPMLNNGSIVGINIMLPQKHSTGTIEFKIFLGYKSYSNLDSAIPITENLTIDNTKNYKSIEFNPLNYTIKGSSLLGVKITTSSDFVKSYENEFNDIYCELIVEY